MFNVLAGNDGPAVSSFFKQGDGRRREVGISERADRHRDEAQESRTGVEDGGAAVGAGVEGRRCSALAPGRVLAELPRWLRVGLRKASLGGKRAATALLALEAMTYRYPSESSHLTCAGTPLKERLPAPPCRKEIEIRQTGSRR